MQEGKLGKDAEEGAQEVGGRAQDELAVGDTKFGRLIREKMDIQCVNNPAVAEVMRGIRANIDCLLQ